MLKKIFLTGSAMLALSIPAYASEELNLSSESLTVETSLSVLNGQSREFVYEDGDNASQLFWQIKNVPIVNAGITWDAYSWLSLNASGWTTLASSGSGMDDYDWFIPEQSHWSHWSTHPRTRLNFANQFDLKATGWLVKDEHFHFGAMVGFQETRFSWLAIGGHYNYWNGQEIGDFPRNEHGIGYRQKFRVPYLGMTGKYIYRDFDLIATFKFSPWVEARDHDAHYAGGLRFDDSSNNSSFYSGTLNAGYHITPQARVFTEVTWTRYSEGRGGAYTFDKNTGQTSYIDDAAGIQNNNYTIGAGIQYRF